MNAKTSIFTRATAAASLVGAMMITAAAPAPAAAQGLGSGVLNCGAPGTSQPIGAVIGGVLGAALGSNLAKNDRGTGTALGAVAGAATGSYIGCRNQRAAAVNNGYAQGPAQPAYYNRGYDRSAAGSYVAASNLNVRSAPSTGAARVGQIGAGQSFRAVGRDGAWLVVSNGSNLGYVHGNYAHAAGGYQQAGYGY